MMTVKKWTVLLAFSAVAAGACSDADPGPSHSTDAGVRDDTAATPEVAEIWMNPTSLRLALGESATVEASARDVAQVEVEDAAITWRSSDEDVVRVDQEGNVVATGPGVAYVEAVVGEVVGRCEIEVYDSVDAVEIVWSGEAVHPGESFEPGLRLYGSRGDEISADGWTDRWASLDPQIIEHLGEGRFVGLRPGTAEIAVVVNEKRATATVEIGAYRDLQVHLSADRWRVRRGKSTQLSATVYGPGAEFELSHIPVEWTSSDPAVVEVTDDGVASGRALGSAVVTASARDAEASHAMRIFGSYSQIDAGRRHACGLYEGVAVCWGENRAGQLGTDDFVSRSRPTQVVGVHAFAQISAGGDFTCALDADGRAYCWGGNDDGQLGDGTRAAHTRPKPVASDTRFVTISAGVAHVCGLDAQGLAWCWGSGDDGRLGTGVVDDSLTPTAVVDGHSFETISAGEHTCALAEGGAETWCWGDNDFGEIGKPPPWFPGDTNNTPSSAVPVLATSSKTFVSVSAGDEFSCALADDGQVYCWGSNHDDQFGRTVYSGGEVVTIVSQSSWPVALHEAPVAYDAVAASYHPCAIREGKVFCWREDFHGDPTTSGFAPVPSPVQLTGVGAAVSVTTGYKFSCALDDVGDAFCSGWGDEGALGNGSLDGSSRRAFEPLALPELTTAP